MDLRKNVKMKNNLVKKIIRSSIVTMLIIISTLYTVIVSSTAMNPIVPVPLYCAVLILIMAVNLLTLIMYLLNKEIKVIRIIVSSISLAFYLAIVVVFLYDYYAWSCTIILLALLILDIFFKPLKHE